MTKDEVQHIVEIVLAAQKEKRTTDVDEIVLKAISAILTSFGIEEEDRKEFQADLAHLRRWRKSVEQAQTLTFKVIVGTIVSGLVAAAWLGIKALVSLKSGG